MNIGTRQQGREVRVTNLQLRFEGRILVMRMPVLITNYTRVDV